MYLGLKLNSDRPKRLISKENEKKIKSDRTNPKWPKVFESPAQQKDYPETRQLTRHSKT